MYQKLNQKLKEAYISFRVTDQEVAILGEFIEDGVTLCP